MLVNFSLQEIPNYDNSRLASSEDSADDPLDRLRLLAQSERVDGAIRDSLGKYVR